MNLIREKEMNCSSQLGTGLNPFILFLQERRLHTSSLNYLIKTVQSIEDRALSVLIDPISA